MESQSRDALGIVSYYVAGGPEYCAKINFVPSDGIFNLGECEMLILAGRQAGGHRGTPGFFTGGCGQGENIVDCERALNQPIKMAGQRRRTNEQER